jgi:bacterioferritin
MGVPGTLAQRASAERFAIEIYAYIIRWIGKDDPTTRKLITNILKVEEEHADDMANLLTQVR